jgi:perosamine synthetase
VAERAIPISQPQLGPEVEALVLEVLRSGRLAQGPMVERFEELCRRMAGAGHAVAVANGTVSLEAALEVLGVGPGDEVVTSPLTFAATLNAILRAGATARFADVAPDGTVDPDAAAALVGRRTAALLPVHLYGLPADMPALAGLAASAGLGLVEDAAQAHGAAVAGRPAGSFGLASFSFYASKNVASGEGGVVTCQDAGTARHLRLLRNQGMAERYRYELVGRNLRMTELQAAVAIPQLERLDAGAARRAANAALLDELLAADGRVERLPLPAGRRHAWHQYTVLLPPGTDRDAVVAAMAAAGVQAGVYYPRLVWDHPVYRDHPGVVADPSPAAAAIAARCLSLPVHPGCSAGDLERVGAALAAALDQPAAIRS